MFEQVEGLLAEYADLETRMSDPALHADQNQARTIGRRYAELGPVVVAYRDWRTTADDLAAAKELAQDDPSFYAEAEQLEAALLTKAERLRLLLLPRDPDDDKDVILEVQAGPGWRRVGAVRRRPAADVPRYAERQGWNTELLDATESDLGGYKAATIAVRGRRDPKPWGRLKYEGGVHRVQRVPVTEAQGRIHTSAAGVLVLPEAEDVEVEIDPNDLRIDVYRSSGPGGQSVNTTDSAVRITHVPTGIVVSCQNEKSQLQNKESAMRILRARMLAAAQEQADAEASAARRSQVRTVDRSERVRTYNFPENRISDHRVNYKAYNLDQVLDGDLDAVVQALADADTAAILGTEQ